MPPGDNRSFCSDERTCEQVAPNLDNNIRPMTAQEFVDYLIAQDQLDNVMAALRKLGFGVDFVADKVLSAGGDVTIARTAMLWQGMPNKHDRKRTRQLFDLLTEAGLLVPKGDDETWTPKL
jgi:hypothetical protein